MADSSMKSVNLKQREHRTGRELVTCTAALILLILVSAFATIYSTHACRALYTQLQVLESSQWYLQEDYGRLLLEQSTWASHYRVEKVARSELGMGAPDLQKFKVLPQ
ncbi:MAG: cell division protein FtsL [Halioglobus sp.]